MRAGVCSRLIGAGLPADLAEQWLVAWEARAEPKVVERAGEFWDSGYAWIINERATRRVP